MNNLKAEIEKILLSMGAGTYTKRMTDGMDFEFIELDWESSPVINQYTDELLTLFESMIPGEVDEDGSSGKWVNGFNDCRKVILNNIRGEE